MHVKDGGVPTPLQPSHITTLILQPQDPAAEAPSDSPQQEHAQSRASVSLYVLLPLVFFSSHKVTPLSKASLSLQSLHNGPNKELNQLMTGLFRLARALSWMLTLINWLHCPRGSRARKERTCVARERRHTQTLIFAKLSVLIKFPGRLVLENELNCVV